MRKTRVIPVLLLYNNGFYKTRQFKDLSYVGDPLNTIKLFNEKEVDELCILDIGVSKNNSTLNYNLLKQISAECFVPLSYGGGIKSVSDAKNVLQLGFEKIIVNSGFFSNPELFVKISVRIWFPESVLDLLILSRIFLRNFLYSQQ